MAFCYDYPRPSLTVDCCVFGRKNNATYILLVKRGKAPFMNQWALPGGFVEMDELLAAAASRELFEETGIKIKEMKQLHVFDGLQRDPRGRTISVVFWAFSNQLPEPHAGSDAKHAQWFEIDQLPPLAFDHQDIITLARKKISV
jgi:8-oxo-dGTP diphosphatase